MQQLAPQNTALPAMTSGQLLTFIMVMAALGLVFLISSGMWFFPVNNEENPLFSARVGGRLGFNAMLAVLLGLNLLFYRQLIKLYTEYKLLLAIVGIYFLSSFTSYDTAVSLKYAFRLLLFTSVFMLLAELLPPQQLQRFLLVFFGVTTSLSVVYCAIFSQYGVMSGMHSGAWRGLFSHKNQFGYYCVYSAILFLSMSLYSFGWRQLVSLGLAGLSMIMLVLSHSSGALSALAVTLLCFMLISRSQRLGMGIKTLPLMLTMLVIILAVPFGGLAFEFILGLLGRDPSLTNRTDIWDFYLLEFQRQPFLGLGPDAYLRNPAMHDRMISFRGLGTTKTPHNGYIHMLNEVGLIGTGAYILMIIRIIYRGIQHCLFGNHPIFKVLFVMTVIQIMRGMVETNGSVVINPFYGLVVVAYVVLHKYPLQQQAQPSHQL